MQTVVAGHHAEVRRQEPKSVCAGMDRHGVSLAGPPSGYRMSSVAAARAKAAALKAAGGDLHAKIEKLIGNHPDKAWCERAGPSTLSVEKVFFVCRCDIHLSRRITSYHVCDIAVIRLADML